MNKFKIAIVFDRKLFVILFAIFILFTVIGTLSHEGGHYLMATLLGHGATLHAASVTYDLNCTPGSSDDFFITAAGPVQTMLTGSIGLLIIFLCRKKFLASSALSAAQWSLVFFSLFWLRQLANFLGLVVSYLFTGKISTRSDEIRLAMQFGWPRTSLLATTAFISLIVFFTILYYIPAKQRFTFLCALATGSLIGYIVWLHWLGPIVLP